MFKYITYLFLFFILRNISATAQTWSTPVKVVNPFTGTGADIGRYSKLLVVNGRPAMVYTDQTHNFLMYVRTTDASGSAWGTPVILDSIISQQYLSLQIINGNPAVSYYDGTHGDLKYVRAADASGTTWNAPLTLDATGGQYSSLQAVNGNPAIAYYDNFNLDLKYIRASDASGTVWNTPLTLDATGDVGKNCSLQVINGSPAIAYCSIYNGGNLSNVYYMQATDASGTAWSTRVVVTDGSHDYINAISLSLLPVNGNPAIASYDTYAGLQYIRATNASGTAWATKITVDATAKNLSCSLQIINGNPAISYSYDIYPALILKFVRATNTLGTAWGTPVTVDASANVGNYNSLQTVNGNPAIGYYDETNKNLKYVRAADVSGTSWGTSISLDATGNSGQYASLQIVSSNPAIAYFDQDNFNLKYVRAANSEGTAWSEPITLDNSGNVGLNNSLQIVNGNPAVSYYDAQNKILKYVRATNALGTAWGTPAVIDATVGVGNFNSMQIVNGNPAVAYFDIANNNPDLKFVRANDPSGNSWGTPVIIDATGFVGLRPSLQIVNGNPAISYYDNTNHNLKYIRATNASGTAWSTPVTVDAAGDVGLYSSLQIVNGNPAISYYDQGNYDLKYVRATDLSGTAWGTPVTVDAPGLVGYNTTLEIVNGKPAITYDEDNGQSTNLKYVRATDASGNVWEAAVILGQNATMASMVSRANSVFVGYYNSASQLPYFIYGFVSLTTDYFRTKDGGNWNDIATWESSHDGSNWYNATLTPDLNANTITILSGHKISITEDVTVDQAIINSGAAVNVVPGVVLTINNGTGTDLAINSGGSLTLKSNASGEGSIGTSAGSVSGNVTVERYFSNRRAWRLLSIPFSNSTQTIKSSWMEGATNSADNPNNPYGTHITTFTADPNAANFDAVKPASSIRIYASDKFTSDATHTPNTTSKITDNDAYFLFVRGNRSVDRTTTTVASTAILRITGTATSGSVTKGLAGKGFTLVPNPYPSAIDFNKVKAANTSITTFYVWDANLGGTNGVGQYRTVEITGSSPNYFYTATPGSSSTSWRFIESGTAFLIPGVTPVDFTEAMKTAGVPPSSMLRAPSVNQVELVINLNVVNADNTTSLADGVREVFDNNYSAAVDNNDAKKITGFGPDLGLSSNNEILAVEKRPLPNATEVISLNLSGAAQGNYEFELQPANLPAGPTLYLKDNYLGTYTPVDLTRDTKIAFTINADAVSSSQNRFSILFSKPNLNLQSSIVVYPNPIQNGTVTLQMNNMPKGPYQVRLLNALGQTVLSKQINHTEGSSTETFNVNKVKGAYTLEVTKPDNSKQNNKIIIN